MKKVVLSVLASLALTVSSLSAANVLATVNGQEITNSEIAQILRNPKINFNTLPKETQKKVINQAIEKKLLTMEAMKSGVEKQTSYKNALEKLKQDLALEIWMQSEFKKIKITQADKESFYNKNKAKFQTQEALEARHILVKTQKEAQAVIQRLDKAKNKKATFEKIAKELSIGPTGAKGGYLGKFSPKQMVPEFSKAASSLKKGSYSKTPVKTQFGFHVIYLENKVAAKVLSLKEVEKKITKIIIQKRYSEQIKTNVQRLRKTAKIVIK